ncbi:hypothetical protein AB1Y20_002234 [Prymnesium parvum]|uniref:DUF389 domain-containing protein n=1 Tax=Prymnesium parvum TaxID=97485 RepID=A0AB34JA33_PRYPA
MSRRIHCCIPASEEFVLTSIRSLLVASAARNIMELHAEQPRMNGPSVPYVVLQFTVAVKHSGRTLAELENLRELMDSGSIECFELRSSTPSAAQYADAPRRRFRLSDRASFDEIYELVDNSSHLTFDFLLLCAVASIVCALGLVTDRSDMLTASMLISPLMGPLMATTFGACTLDFSFLSRGIRNELIGVAICFFIGACTGGIVCATSDPTHQPLPDVPSLTPEALHYKPGDLILGVAVALPSGAILALSVSAGLSQTIVGVAIATALLPPVVSAGINVAASFYYLRQDGSAAADERLQFAFYAMMMFLINWVCIFIGAAFCLRVKQVGPKLMRSLQAQLSRSPTVVDFDQDGTPAQVQRRRSPSDAANTPRRLSLSSALLRANSSNLGKLEPEYAPNSCRESLLAQSSSHVEQVEQSRPS